MSKQALEGQRINAFLMDPKDLTLVTDKNHALYDERVDMPVSEGMVKNIMRRGVKVPIMVSKDGDTVLVVAGRQRVKATLEANKRLKADGQETIKIPCMVEKGSDDDKVEVMILENEIRSADSILTRINKVKRLLERGRTEADVAVTFGVSTQTIRNYVAISSCCKAVLDAIEAGSLQASAAMSLAYLSAANQKKALEKITSGAKGKKKTSVSKARRIAKGKGDSEAPSRKGIIKVFTFYKHTVERDDFVKCLDWILYGVSCKQVEDALKATLVPVKADSVAGIDYIFPDAK